MTDQVIFEVASSPGLSGGVAVSGSLKRSPADYMSSAELSHCGDHYSSSGGGGSNSDCAQSMGDGTPKSPKRTAISVLFDAQDEDDSNSDEDSTKTDDEDSEWDEWEAPDDFDSPDEDLQELFGQVSGCRGFGLMFTNLTTSERGNGPTTTTATNFCDTNGGGTSTMMSTTASNAAPKACDFIFNAMGTILGCSRTRNFMSNAGSSFLSAAFNSSGIVPSQSISITTANFPANLQHQQQHSSSSSSANSIAIPAVLQNGHCSHQDLTSSASPSSPASYFDDSLSPNSFSFPALTEEDIKRNQQALAEEEASDLAKKEANRKWDETLLLWREEMGPKGYLLDSDLIDGKVDVAEKDDAKSENEIFHCEMEDNNNDEEFSEDQTDCFMVMTVTVDDEHNEHDDDGYQSKVSSTYSSQMEAPSDNVNNCRVRSIRFSAQPPKVHYIDLVDECRSEHWSLVATDRVRLHESMNRLLAPIFDPHHRQRVFKERFESATEEQVKEDVVLENDKNEAVVVELKKEETLKS